MPVEVLTYRLEYRGTPVGRHVLRSEEQGRQAFLEARLDLQGSLGEARVTQLSRCHREKMTSYEFRERNQDRQGTRDFVVEFDGRDGLVKARRDRNERAEMPYLKPFRDPLSLLRQVRRLVDPQESVRVPMLGKDVLVEPLGDVTLETALGPRRAAAYLLQPGGAYLWIDRGPRAAILRFTQRVQNHLLEGHLVTEGSDATLSAWPELTADDEGQRKRKRRRKRRRKRSRGGRN